MSMALSALVADHKAQLGDSSGPFGTFGDADFRRHIATAASDLIVKRPLIKFHTVTLVAGQTTYLPAADIVRPLRSEWGRDCQRVVNSWEAAYPRALPKLRLVENGMLYLVPAPTSTAIGLYGADYEYSYIARHVVSTVETDTTVADGDRDILLLRAAIIALRELATRNITKPIKLNRGVAPAQAETTPQDAYELLINEWEAIQ